MKILFTGETPRLPESDPQRDRSAGVPRLSDHLLTKHHARLLRPDDAPVMAGAAAPGATVYRYNRLLMCHRLLGDQEKLSEMDQALASRGLRVDRSVLGKGPLSPRFHRVDVAVGDAERPGTVDAWQVLQNLRGAVDLGHCSPEVTSRMRLEHLMVGSALQGAGAFLGMGDDQGEPRGGVPVPGNYLARAYSGRMPVDLVVPMPRRRPLSAVPGGRRPVVAVLDSGVSPTHPAFEVSERQDRADTFVTVDSALQEELAAGADPESPQIHGPWDVMVTESSLTGEITSHFGHGTFITGLIRQLAPDAQVRSIRVMHNDGMVYEHECLAALVSLVEEVERARAGDPTAQPVDLVCLSFGYTDEDPDDRPGGPIAAAIDRLTDLGVPVVAAAGNYASTRPFYPAAFAAGSRPQQAAPVISVGALNPNGSVAMFSNDGPWVSCFATGAALVSTFPTYADGAENPWRSSRPGGRHRETMDPDDFGSGYAVWSGTSFAAPLVAARLAAALLDHADTTDLASQELAAVTHRVQAAVKAIGG